MRQRSKQTYIGNPYEDANIFSRLSYWWLRNLLKTGLKQEITENDIYRAAKTHKSVEITRVCSKHWEKEKQKSKPSFLNVLFKVYGPIVLIFGFIGVSVKSVSRILRPLFLGGLILYYTQTNDDTNVSLTDAYLYATGIVVSTLMPLFLFHPMQLMYFENSMKIKVACTALIYEKILRMSVCTVTDGINGQAVNLISNDVATFDYATCFLQELWVGPVEAIVMGYFIYREIGYSGLIGIAVMVAFIPLQVWLGKMAAKIRLRTALRTDKRIKFMNEIIQGVQTIKMYALEYIFGKNVDNVRTKELNEIKKSLFVKATLLSFHVLPQLAIFVSFVMYAYLSSDPITAKKAFIVIAYFNALRQSLIDFWPLAISSVAEGYVSCKRIEKFLLLNEEKQKHIGTIPKLNVFDDDFKAIQKRTVMNNVKQHPYIELKEATAYWTQQEKHEEAINNISLKLEGPNIVAVVGAVGTGKSSLLQVILGELELDYGSVAINGDISYCSQEPWIFDASVKSNIIFNENFDEERYRNVLDVCALQTDIKSLQYGDETIVGEQGTMLSGGQKARINLARTIYKKADIYLLDDPLSALDANVGKFIFKECVMGFLKDKLCVLVTHQMQYLSQAHHIVIMQMGGKIGIHGTYETVLNDPIFTKNIAASSSLVTANDINDDNNNEQESKQHNRTNVVVNKIHLSELNDTDTSNVDENTVPGSVTEEKIANGKVHQSQQPEKEEQSVGAVNMNVYLEYFKSVKSWLLIILVFTLFLSTQVFSSSADYFVSLWTTWEEKEHTSDTNWSTEKFVYIYAAIITALVLSITTRSFIYYLMCIRTSRNLHNMLYEGVVRAKMLFFNKNSSGRILNRFSKDIGSIDNFLPVVLVDTLIFFFELTGVIVLISSMNLYLIIPTVMMAVLFYFLRYTFLTTARNVKRVEAVTRSPIFSHINATFQGLATIKSSNGQLQAIEQLQSCIDSNTSASFLFIATARGFAFWLDMVSALYLTMVTYAFLVLGQDTVGGNVGLAITQAINLVGMCNWGLRQTSELENQMTSVERVIEYGTRLDKEPPLETPATKMPIKVWPEKGKIDFCNVAMKYSDDSDYVLRDVHFTVRENEKVGIVGRTGAGKSSITQALFRLTDYDGHILIDDIDLKSLGLHTFRRKVSIISQDPVLFSGTLRMNIDPFLERSDAELWTALEQVELKSVVSAAPAGLDLHIADAGSNFSIGQRQLICMARALLRNNKIMVLDEATANVDTITDELIQKTIRKTFKDCTVLTIAHRINTLLDYDRIIVMHNGKIVENDTPNNLLHVSGGYFHQLVHESGINH